MNGEFIRIETLEEIATLKRENKRLKELKLSNDKNVLDANIKLQDENNMLKRDIQILEKRIDEATRKLKEHKKDLDYEPWSEYTISGTILFDLAGILEGE